jgi:hypothetical protein
MKWARLLSAQSRRAFVVVGLTAVLSAASSLRAEPVQTPPAQAAAPQADPLKFDIDSPVLLLYTVKADKAEDFESVWAAIRAGLSKSDKPEMKSFGESLRFYKIDSAAGAPVIYVFQLDPPSKTISYNPIKLLYKTEGGVFEYAEATPLYEKLKGTGVLDGGGITIWRLKKIGD